MSEIIIIGEERMVDVNIIDKAFTQPAENAEFHWYLHTDHTDYLPYLIYAKSLVNDVLTFRGVDIRAPTTTFGPDHTNNALNYTVNLGHVKYVYREKPSTLDGLEPDGNKTYALLFLSDTYRDTYDTQGRLTAARGGPKWPVGAGSKLVALRKELAKTKADFAQALQDLKEMLVKDSDDRQAKVDALISKFLP